MTRVGATARTKAFAFRLPEGAMKMETLHRSLSLIAAMAALALSGASSAQAIQASLPASAVVRPGGSNTVAISVDNATGRFGAFFAVRYDPSKVTPGSVVTTGAAAGCPVYINTEDPIDQIRVSMACSTPLQGGGPLAVITFNGNPGAAGISPLTFVACQFDEENPSACQTSDGEIFVTDCLLNVDGKGGTATGITDGVYVYRALSSLGKVVPDLHRSQDPTIPSDAVIGARVTSIAGLLNVDGKNGTQGITDGVYIYRRLSSLGKVVPDLHRSQDPTIPSDAVIGANVDALCP
jgi:hypothetical protein